MYGYIYKTTNLINNKIYVGQHKYSKKGIDPNYIGSGKLLLEAVKKYGLDNFYCEIIDICQTEKELEEKELYWIKELKSTTDYNNYNISDGGFVPRFSGPRNPNYGRHWNMTDEQKENLSKKLKGHKPTFTGTHTEEYKEMMKLVSRQNNLNRDPSIYNKVSETAKGNKMMNKDGVCKRVHPENFNEYLDNGWKFGGLSRKGKYTDRKQSKPANFTTKGKIAINNNEINKFIPESDVELYLTKGWKLGLKKRANQ